MSKHDRKPIAAHIRRFARCSARAAGRATIPSHLPTQRFEIPGHASELRILAPQGLGSVVKVSNRLLLLVDGFRDPGLALGEILHALRETGQFAGIFALDQITQGPRGPGQVLVQFLEPDRNVLMLTLDGADSGRGQDRMLST